jgi:hypothetical protein
MTRGGQKAANWIEAYCVYRTDSTKASTFS